MPILPFEIHELEAKYIGTGDRLPPTLYTLHHFPPTHTHTHLKHTNNTKLLY